MRKTRVIILISLVLMLSSIFIGIVFGEINVPEGNIELVDPQEKTLSLGEHFTRDNFIIEATDFIENMTVITVYDGTT